MSRSARTQIIEEKINFEKTKVSVATVTPLSRLKELEQSKKWKECATQAPQVFAKYPSVKSWVLNTWLVCARNAKMPAPALTALDKNKNLLVDSPARKVLREEMLRFRTAIIEDSLKSDPKVAWSQIQALWDVSQDKEFKAKILFWSGELAANAHKLIAAEDLYKQSLDLADSKPVRDRLSAIQLALNRKPEDAVNGKTRNSIPLNDGELKFEERFSASLQNNDLIAFVEDAVHYLNQFPNGKRAKWAQEKILDIYLNFLDKPQDEKFFSLREKVIRQFEKIDASRLIEMAKILHRRSDYLGSMRLAERALGSLSRSPQAASALYMAGRSAQFLGEYKAAQKYFDRYMEAHSQGDDLGEVAFRLALVHIRTGNYSAAVAVLEKILLNKAADRYELNARYWLVRALQATKNPRAEDELNLLITKFPFSYYGLRLKLEKQGAKLQELLPLPQGAVPQEVLSLTEFQKQIWDRALLLGKNGWVGEAFQEIAEMTWPRAARLKAILAQKLFESKIYWTGIKLVNEAIDEDPTLRATDVLILAFPQAYEEAIVAQAQKSKLNPVLVKSLIRQESAFNERATSTSKAMGLMQLIPPTAKEVASDLGLTGLDLPEDSYLPDVNLKMGTYYIARVIRKFDGNVPMGLAGYNAGPHKMQAFIKARPEVFETKSRFSSQWGDEIWFDELPWSETSFYVKAILRNTMIYRWLEQGALEVAPVVWQDLVVLPSETGLDHGPDSSPKTSM